MKRLTTSRGDIYFPATQESAYTDIVRKCGKIEDIEEELCLDIETFYKLLKCDGVFLKDGSYTDVIAIAVPMKMVFDYKYDKNLYFKDYGKTWALTREGINNDK